MVKKALCGLHNQRTVQEEPGRQPQQPDNDVQAWLSPHRTEHRPNQIN